MISTLNPRIGRAIAIGSLIAIAGALYFGIVAPIVGQLTDGQEALTQTGMIAARYHEASEKLPAQRATLAELSQNQQAQSGFLAATNENLAAAELQSRLKDIVSSSGGELKSAEILTSQDEGHFRRIAIRGELSATVPAVEKILTAVENASPMLFFDNLDLHSHAADRQQDRNEDIVILEMTVDIFGYMRVSQ